MPDKKVLAEIGVAAICEFLKAAIQTADNAGDAVTQLSQATNMSIQELVSALNGDRPCAVGFTATASGWGENTEEDTSSVFPYAYDISAEDLTDEELAFAMVSPGSAGIAKACRMGQVCRTCSGILRLYAKRQPTGNITGEYWIINGRAAETDESETETEAEPETGTEGGSES